MKFNKFSLYAMTLGIIAMLSSCQTDYDEPSLIVPEATMTANTTILELKNVLAGKASIKIPNKQEAAEGVEAVPYIIKGRVISSDVSGNIFKSLVIQDETSAISFSINQGNLYTNYRVGQEVVVNVTGLWGGLYHDLICLGAGANEYGSLVTSRMSFAAFKEHSQLNGLPNENMKYITMSGIKPANNPYTITVNSIASLPASGEDLWAMQSQLVEIPNVYFEEADGVTPYALKDENVSRNIKDASGSSMIVRNSGYSNFYNTALPTGTGTVRGILSYYGGAWQLLLRDLSDVIFDGAGTKETPYTVDEAIAMDNNGRFAWTEGYIVGSVKAGVNTITSNDDILFSDDADLDNTLVIASDANCKDYTKCMVVSLPAGSLLREYGNLVDHKDNYGRKISVNGSYNQLLGINGITDCAGTIADFYIDGLVIDGVTGEGNGTTSNPYTVKFVLNNSNQEQIGVYVSGYIVGFVSGTSYENGAHFDANTDGADYNNGNIIIADSPEVNDISKAIPVKLKSSDRAAVGLRTNPENLGKKIMFKATIGKYMDVPGLSSTETYQFLP